MVSAGASRPCIALSEILCMGEQGAGEQRRRDCVPWLSIQCLDLRPARPSLVLSSLLSVSARPRHHLPRRSRGNLQDSRLLAGARCIRFPDRCGPVRRRRGPSEPIAETSLRVLWRNARLPVVAQGRLGAAGGSQRARLRTSEVFRRWLAHPHAVRLPGQSAPVFIACGRASRAPAAISDHTSEAAAVGPVGPVSAQP